MKLLYTDIRTSLTEILTREAEELVAAGFFCDYRHAFRSNGSLPGFK